VKQYLLDTNYLLRFLLNDNKEQAKKAADLLFLAEEGKASLTIPLLVFVEAAYILTKVYNYSRFRVSDALSQIAENPAFDIEKREILLSAFKKYPDTTISFVDILISEQARIEGKQLATFDRKLEKQSGNK
jgi:predicted nucleic-acid-binding protein